MLLCVKFHKVVDWIDIFTGTFNMANAAHEYRYRSAIFYVGGKWLMPVKRV